MTRGLDVIRVFMFTFLLTGGILMSPLPVSGQDGGAAFDIAPFALPNPPLGEIRFEEPRDIAAVEVVFTGQSPSEVGLSYLHHTWPERRIEDSRPFEDPCRFGWFPIDDWFTSGWTGANTEVKWLDQNTARITFRPLTSEFPEMTMYDVTFRRTVGIRLEVKDLTQIKTTRIFTTAPASTTTIRVHLDAGKATTGGRIDLSTYNAVIQKVAAVSGATVEGNSIRLNASGERVFQISLAHMKPAGYQSGDEGHVTFTLAEDTFTISLASLEAQGPIWFEDRGVYITRAGDATSFADYQKRIEGSKTFSQRVLDHEEQSFGGAFNGQPRRHAVGMPLGCKLAHERIWIEANGDIVLQKGTFPLVQGKDSARFKNQDNGRFYFGLEQLPVEARFADPGPVLVDHHQFRNKDIRIEQTAFAVPLEKPILEGNLQGDDTVVGMVRFRLTNTGSESARAELPMQYSSQSRRSENRQNARHNPNWDGNLIPVSPRDPIVFKAGLITSEWEGGPVTRASLRTGMAVKEEKGGLLLSQDLEPGQSCEVVLVVPYIVVDKPEELEKLASLDFENCYREVRTFWLAENARGASIQTAEPRLDSLHASHLSHVQISDILMPDGDGLINTSVGTSVYGNYTNESCMIIHELDQRGLHEDAQKRIDLWIKYQSTKETLGRFTDKEGVFFGAGGFEAGKTYTQHHGWVLWMIAEHYFLSGDEDWLKQTAAPLIAGMEWVFRQRKETMKSLPHSRGWEYGFLPAGALEDVGDYCYWLSTNALTWRGVNQAAKALAAIGHPEAARLQQEADAYGKDLVKGFETMRQHTPLARLRDGRWVPIYPSRLYLRGRDFGWAREVLEGSVYLLISGLFPVDGKEAGWILDDFQDNRYPSPPFGYPIPNIEDNWFDNAGFSIQPNLLAGLLPFLERDEPEVYIWMFFNAWCACYSEEINALVEHPFPFLGFSNCAHYKTSDESNAVNWLRYMFVYTTRGTLHLGRALPREWFTQEIPLRANGVATRYGKVSVEYLPSADQNTIIANAQLDLRSQPERTLLRIRHPEKRSIKSVKVNGETSDRFDAEKGDIDLTGLQGTVHVEASY